MTSDRKEEELERPRADESAAESSADARVEADVEDRSASGADPQTPDAPQGDSTGGEGQAADGLRRELEDMRERYLRLAAEFDNYRKRTERERAEHSVRAQGTLVKGLLDAIDDLERVADYTEETTTVSALLEGVQMVERKLLRALEAAGLERIDARGSAFDPEHHEALMTAATDHPHEDDTVGEVFQQGYRFQGQLLRPARVQVRKHAG